MNTDRINILLDEIEATNEFASFVETLGETLEEQWLDIVACGVIDEIYDESGMNGSKRNKNPAIKRAIALWIAYGLAINKKKVENWVYNKIISRVSSSSRYSNYVKGVRDYFTYVFNRGGQNELDFLVGKGILEFNLTNEYYKGKIRERVINLYSDWSKTTAKKFTAEVMTGIKKKESKTEMVTRIVATTKKMADYRKEIISTTETNGTLEYARLETARMNGVEWKIWHTAEDASVCKVCNGLNGETIPVDEAFSSGVECPPIHVNCRCYCDYVYDDYSDTVDKKKKDVYIFYQNEKDRIYPIGLNKEYIWTGGKVYRGRDRDMDSFIGIFSKEDYKAMKGKELDSLVEFVRGIPYTQLPYETYFSTADFRSRISNNPLLSMTERIEITGKTDGELAVIMAKAILTETGVSQLLKKI